MMKIIKTENRRTFDAYVQSHPYGHYMKTSMWGEFKKKTEKTSYEMLAFYEGEKLCGTAMVIKGRWLSHTYLHIPEGPCIDYEDTALRNAVFELLKKYADEKKVLFLRIDPNVVRLSRDIKGNVKEGCNHEDVTDDLKKAGYIHKGYGYGYDGSWVNRFTLILNISAGPQAFINNFTKERKRLINRNARWHVAVKEAERSDIPVLMKYEKQLAGRYGFKPHTASFFNCLLDAFGENALFIKTTVDLAAMAEVLKKDINAKQYRNDTEALEAFRANIEKAEALKASYGEKVDIAAGIFVWLGDKAWNLYMYSDHSDFNFVSPSDSLHYYAMSRMYEQGVSHYDFVGFSGSTEKDDFYYGLYEYKASFGSEFTERIGQFDYVRDEAKMKRFLLEWRYVKGAERRLKRLFYTKKNKI